MCVDKFMKQNIINIPLRIIVALTIATIRNVRPVIWSEVDMPILSPLPPYPHIK